MATMNAHALRRESGLALAPQRQQAFPTHRRTTRAAAQKQQQQKQQTINYGSDWYRATREASRPVRTVREEIEYRRRANELANNGKERKDLYTDNWEGSEYKGSPFNILTLLAGLFVLVPFAGLVFAWFGYGVYWG